MAASRSATWYTSRDGSRNPATIQSFGENARATTLWSMRKLSVRGAPCWALARSLRKSSWLGDVVACQWPSGLKAVAHPHWKLSPVRVEVWLVRVKEEGRLPPSRAPLYIGLTGSRVHWLVFYLLGCSVFQEFLDRSQ